MNLISNAYVHVGFTTLNGCGDIWKHITLYACENLFSLSFSVVMNGISRCDFRHFIVASESKLKLSDKGFKELIKISHRYRNSS